MFLKISLVQLNIFTYISIKFDNFYRKWNFLRISLWKLRKWILLILWKIAIKHNFDWKYYTFFFFFVGCVCIYITYQIKKCVYIIKKACVFVYVYVVVLINILVLQLNPSKQKFLAPPPYLWGERLDRRENRIIQLWIANDSLPSHLICMSLFYCFISILYLCVLVDDSVMINLTVDTVCQDLSKWKR